MSLTCGGISKAAAEASGPVARLKTFEAQAAATILIKAMCVCRCVCVCVCMYVCARVCMCVCVLQLTTPWKSSSSFCVCLYTCTSTATCSPKKSYGSSSERYGHLLDVFFLDVLVLTLTRLHLENRVFSAHCLQLWDPAWLGSMNNLSPVKHVRT